MRIKVTHDIDDLANDMVAVARNARSDMVKVVRNGIRVGNAVAKDYARVSAGAHGKHYHRAFSAEMHGIVSFGGTAGISGEYGPDISKPQGGMSFENGSINQKPHRDLAKSADLIGPSFAQEVRQMTAEWFW